MTKALAARLRELNEKATKGRWRDQPSMHGNEYRYVQFGDDDCYTTLEILPADAKLIVALHKNLPAILTALEGVEEMQSALRAIELVVDGLNTKAFRQKPETQAALDRTKSRARAALKEKP